MEGTNSSPFKANALSPGDNLVGISAFPSKASSSIQLVHPMNKPMIVKLDGSNYLTWKGHVLTTIRGYGLETLHNPEFVAHQCQDQLLKLWLLSSITSDLLPQFVGYESAHSI